MSTGKKLNRIAANYMWSDAPKAKPTTSKLDEPATKEERERISKEYQQQPGSLSEKIRKLVTGE